MATGRISAHSASVRLPRRYRGARSAEMYRMVVAGLMAALGSAIWLVALVATDFSVVVVSVGLLAMLVVLGRPPASHAARGRHP